MSSSNTAGSRVFITQENTQLNYAPAELYGEVSFLTRDEVSPIPGSLVNSAILEELTRKLETFNFERDFLAPSGSPVICGLAFLALGMRLGRPGSRVGRDADPKTLRVLRWSNRDRVYQPITLHI
jgi:hypothetical protein